MENDYTHRESLKGYNPITGIKFLEIKFYILRPPKKFNFFLHTPINRLKTEIII